MVEPTAEPALITTDELEKLSASGGLARLTPPGSFPVSDLVAGDLPVLAVQGWGLPPKHDALGRGQNKLIFSVCGTICCLGPAAVKVTSWFRR